MKKTHSDNVFLAMLRRLPDCLALSFCFLVCCIPIVTIGSAAIALYDSVVQCFRQGEDNAVQHFFSTLKQELGRGILLTLVWGLVGFVLVFGFLIMAQLAAEGSIWLALSAVYLLTLLLPLGILCWVIPLQARFSYSFGELHRTALSYVVTKLPYTFAVVLVLALGLAILAVVPYLAVVVPAIISWMQSLFIEKALEI